jgi:hypothetical protein
MFSHVNKLLLSLAAITRLLVLGRTLHRTRGSEFDKLSRKSVRV